MTLTDPWTDTEHKTAAPAAPAIYAALNAVQGGLGKLRKEGVGPSSQGSYPFLRYDDLIDRLNPLFAEHGVVLVPRMEVVEQASERFPKVNLQGEVVQDGRPSAIQIVTRIRYEQDFIAAIDGSKVTAVAYGESIDQGDKGIRRAATAAAKEILLRLFAVTTGDEDPDAIDPGDAPAQIVKQNRAEQQIERASRGTRTRTAPPKAPAPEPKPAQPKPEPGSAPASSIGGDERIPPAEPAKPTGPAEPVQQDDGYRPDPADVAYAEQHEPKQAARPVDPAAPSTPPATAAPVDPKTKAEDRDEQLKSLRQSIREALAERSLGRDYVNALGDRLTGKPRAVWFANITDLRRVHKAILDGEATESEPEGKGF